MCLVWLHRARRRAHRGRRRGGRRRRQAVRGGGPVGGVPGAGRVAGADGVPGRHAQVEIVAAKQWSSAPYVRNAASDYPIDLSASRIYERPQLQRGGRAQRRCSPRIWPRLLPTDFRVPIRATGVGRRLAHLLRTTSSPIYERHRPRISGCPDLGGAILATRPESRPAAARRCRIGTIEPERAAPGRTPGWVGTGGLAPTRSFSVGRFDGRHRVRAAGARCRFRLHRGCESLRRTSRIGPKRSRRAVRASSPAPG